MKVPLAAAFILSASASEVASSLDFVSSLTKAIESKSSFVESASTDVVFAEWLLKKEQVNGCSSTDDRQTRGWKMNTCVPSKKYESDGNDINVRYTCTQPAGGGPWTLYAVQYQAWDTSCSSMSIGFESINGLIVGDGVCVNDVDGQNGVTFVCVTDPHPHEAQDAEDIRTELYLSASQCDAKSNLLYFSTQKGCANTDGVGSRRAMWSGYDLFYNENCAGTPFYRNDYHGVYSEFSEPCKQFDGFQAAQQNPAYFKAADPSSFFLRTVAGAKPPSSCPLDLHSVSSSVRLSRQKWLSDKPQSTSASKTSASASTTATRDLPVEPSASKNTDSTTSTLVLPAASSVSTSAIAPSWFTYVCPNFEVKNRNLLSLKSVVQSASKTCLNLILTLETGKDVLVTNNKFVTISIVANDYYYNVLYSRRRALFDNSDVVTALTPYSPGLKRLKVELQVDFSVENIVVPYYTDYFVNVKISYVDESNPGTDVDIDCVTLMH